MQGTIVGVSEEGTYAYYVAGDVLYEAHDESGAWHTTRVAQLSSEDDPDWANNSTTLAQLTARVSPNGEWVAFMSERNLVGYDTQDANPGAYEYEYNGNERAKVVYKEGKPVPAHDEELYVYHAPTGQLACASCEPTGARPTGVEYGGEGRNMVVVSGHDVWKPGVWLAADVPAYTLIEGANGGADLYQPRYLSNEGRLFFNSDDGLVPQDINGTWDVYE